MVIAYSGTNLPVNFLKKKPGDRVKVEYMHCVFSSQTLVFEKIKTILFYRNKNVTV